MTNLLSSTSRLCKSVSEGWNLSSIAQAGHGGHGGLNRLIMERDFWLNWWLVVVRSIMNSIKPEGISKIHHPLMNSGKAVEFLIKTSTTAWFSYLLKCRGVALSYFPRDLSFEDRTELKNSPMTLSLHK